jgi:threonine/homoserine efflux transporter RhtA
MPGPAVAVRLFTPVTEAPMTALRLASSSSIWI